MHLNWKSNVSLPLYEDATLNEELTELVRAAHDDDAFAALLHWAEGKIALDLHELLETHVSAVRQLLSDMPLPGGVTPTTPTWLDCIDAHLRLRDRLRTEVETAEALQTQATEAWHALRQRTAEDHRVRFDHSTALDPAGLERLAVLRKELSQAATRIDAAFEEHVETCHHLAHRDEEFLIFSATAGSIRLDEFDEMTPAEFEKAIARLAQRDGHTLTRRQGGARDLGADVITNTPDGRKIVFQCKHRQPGGRPVGSPVIQTLNGTARPVHHADIVIAVTNSSFTQQARDLAADQNIHLLAGSCLRRWATWGEPLLDVLSLKGPQTS
ncbi:restriction endonuclease [Streptomyces sp. NPDC056527]|uniref:restriction endonuclease n=1 Tax=Streptomyces sp. NPDC056527 TaxID=3345853 RepID=UPI00369E68AD